MRPDGDGWEQLPVAVAGEAERAFDRAYIRSLLKHATRRVEAICKEKGQDLHFTLFQQRYLSDSDAHHYAVANMNLGWEIPGTFDAAVQIRDLDISAVPK